MYKSRSIIDSTDSESEAESRVPSSNHVNQRQAKQRAGEAQKEGGRGRLAEGEAGGTDIERKMH